MTPTNIEIKGLRKEFKTIRRTATALNKIDLKIEKGEFFVILGPSGCGKSTMLNILAGLEKPTGGEIWFGEKLIASSEKKVFLTPKERNVAMVFQSYALYPHMKVFDNIAFPLKIAKTPEVEIKKRVCEVANMLDIGNLLNAKPKELSGGQRQRVAIARAIVRKPSLFLLDEPLSNLDARLRVRLREELKNLQRELGVTTVYVTHDQTEAMTLGDKIAVLREGQLQQMGRPMEVYKNPVNTFVGGFIGTPQMNFVKAEILEESNKLMIVIEDFKIDINSNKSVLFKKPQTREITLGFRPQHINLKGKNNVCFDSEIHFIEHLGPETILHCNIGKEKVLLKVNEDNRLKKGDRVKFSINPENIHIFDQNGDKMSRAE